MSLDEKHLSAATIRTLAPEIAEKAMETIAEVYLGIKPAKIANLRARHREEVEDINTEILKLWSARYTSQFPQVDQYKVGLCVFSSPWIRINNIWRGQPKKSCQKNQIKSLSCGSRVCFGFSGKNHVFFLSLSVSLSFSLFLSLWDVLFVAKKTKPKQTHHEKLLFLFSAFMPEVTSISPRISECRYGCGGARFGCDRRAGKSRQPRGGGRAPVALRKLGTCGKGLTRPLASAAPAKGGGVPDAFGLGHPLGRCSVLWWSYPWHHHITLHLSTVFGSQ